MRFHGVLDMSRLGLLQESVLKAMKALVGDWRD
jgi:hypothetical protein